MTDQEPTPDAQDDAPAAPPAAPVDPLVAHLQQDHPAQHHARLLEQFQTALAADGETAYERWGLTLYHSLPDDAAEAQREVFKVQPKDALDHYNRACLLAQREQFDKAAEAFAEAFRLDPELHEALFNQALARERAGNAAEARKLFKQYVDKFPEQTDAEAIQAHLAETADA